MNDIISAYLKGREEGYFNVRLGYEVLYVNPDVRAFFGKGYQVGKTIRKKESSNETTSSNDTYNEYRKAYITIIGYKSVCENYIADSSLLKDENDERAFEEGCRIGLSYKDKDKDINTSDGNDADLYAIIAGYNNAIEHNLNCSFIVEENVKAYQNGYNVGKICKEIKRDAIEELKKMQIDYYEMRYSKKNRL